jgi:hypothetical protein
MESWTVIDRVDLIVPTLLAAQTQSEAEDVKVARAG